jgi:monovalent cation:H+ antiporter, CPA1 family
MSLLTGAADVAIEQDLKQFLVILLVALSAASLPKLFPILRQVPYTLLLLIVGLSLALVDVRLLHLSPGLILTVFLPPLLFEAAWNMKWSVFRQELVPSSLYAVGGVAITISCVGWSLHQCLGVPWLTAFLVGGCLSATDSASVLGIFRDAGAGKRLTTLLEGEALFNDGAAVVAFSVLVELATSQQSFNLATSVLQFFVVTGMGLCTGGVIGLCIAYFTQSYELDWVEQSLTLVAAYGTYILAEELGGSGVIGVVTAALIIGNFCITPGQAVQKRKTTAEFWEFAVFLANSVLFLLLGDQIHLPKLILNFETSAIAIAAIVGSRALTIYGLSAVSNWIAKSNISWKTQTVLWWAGLRGSVSIALAFSLPLGIAGRDEIIANSFGVVWFTLLIQGLTMRALLGKLGLLEDPALTQQCEAYQELIARREALHQIEQYLLQSQTQIDIHPKLYQSYLDFVSRQRQKLQQDMVVMQEQHPQLQSFSFCQHQEKILELETQVYSQYRQAGLLKNFPVPLMQNIQPIQLFETISTEGLTEEFVKGPALKDARSYAPE